MRRNGYLWTSGVNLDTAVRFADPDFLLECKISASWRRFLCIFLHFICWMSTIFLLPVCLTYWPRKYTTRVDPHVDNSHQVCKTKCFVLLVIFCWVCFFVNTEPTDWPGRTNPKWPILCRTQDVKHILTPLRRKNWETFRGFHGQQRKQISRCLTELE